jgi:hypothetical protein
MIAESNSDTIRHMPLLTKRFSFSIAGALIFCLAVSICADATFAQKKKAKAKSVAPAARTPNKDAARAAEAPSAAEPELELERMPPDPAAENADISITAHVRARSLKFDTVPNPTVEFPGQPARDTVWEAQRENLPTPVEPGVTYRNIGIRLKITSVFRDIDRIVAEALGEVPVTEDANANQARGETRVEPTSKPSANSSTGSSNSRPASAPTPVRTRP